MIGLFDNPLPAVWDGNLRRNADDLLIPLAPDRRKLMFMQEQLQFYSEVSFGRNFVWREEITRQFPQDFLFRGIWKDNQSDTRFLLCKMSMSLYVN
jgi:hypothetical protein